MNVRVNGKTASYFIPSGQTLEFEDVLVSALVIEESGVSYSFTGGYF